MTTKNADPWDSPAVRARIAVMSQQDPERQRFGADCHDYRLRPPLEEGVIRAFEQRLGIALPDSFRSFVRHVADGGAGPDYGVVGLTEEIDDEEALYGLYQECLQPGFLAAPFTYSEKTARPYSLHGTLVIGEIGCGMFSRLVVTGPCAGQVWLDDPDWGGFAPGPDFREWYSTWLASDPPRRGGGPS
ncbi:hypothetical protein P3T35_006949 [Kitasatospora sp. GP30]|uniref:SMI1/KNR4 family protein n=1 Tax=Kitasatospora sp. GP30 TaxID=3035084 RepID=UPI000C70BA7E|nr:SMI1/KNR4 family protein [Kitasatospora sp. GP30]MDH6144900.1 hypothetical protein [Kitasatospora sp. GP30]